MADLYVSEQNLSLHKWGDSVVLKRQGERIREIGLRHLDTIQIFGNVQVSTQLIKRLAHFGVELCFYNIRGELICQLTPPHAKNILLRKRQFETSGDAQFSLEISKALVSAKLRMGWELLRKQAKSKPSLVPKQSQDKQAGQIARIESAKSLESLRGIEGSLAREYYSFYGSLFSGGLSFEKRTRRPPKDPVNSVLSFLYTLVAVKLASLLDGIGYDPYMGYYHQPDYGRQSLALDLLEPLRPALCDRLCLRLFNLQILSENDFVKHEGGMRLCRQAHERFFSQFNQELASERQYGKLKSDFRGLANALQRWLRGCIEKRQVEGISFL